MKALQNHQQKLQEYENKLDIMAARKVVPRQILMPRSCE
jgi:hypothetical protein